MATLVWSQNSEISQKQINSVKICLKRVNVSCGLQEKLQIKQQKQFTFKEHQVS